MCLSVVVCALIISHTYSRTSPSLCSSLALLSSDVPVPLVPGPHEVVFHLGSPGEAAGMSWCYGEPRVITKLKVTPVPFCVVTEVEVPVDLMVCQEDGWRYPMREG